MTITQEQIDTLCNKHNLGQWGFVCAPEDKSELIPPTEEGVNRSLRWFETAGNIPTEKTGSWKIVEIISNKTEQPVQNGAVICAAIISECNVERLSTAAYNAFIWKEEKEITLDAFF